MARIFDVAALDRRSLAFYAPCLCVHPVAITPWMSCRIAFLPSCIFCNAVACRSSSVLFSQSVEVSLSSSGMPIFGVRALAELGLPGSSVPCHTCLNRIHTFVLGETAYRRVSC